MSKEQTLEEFIKDREYRLISNNNRQNIMKYAGEFMIESVKKKYFYNFEWMGLPVIQFPQDLIAIQDIIWKNKPDFIIETGLALGGFHCFLATCMNMYNSDGEVISIEKKIMPGIELEIRKRIGPIGSVIIEGDSTDFEVFKKVRNLCYATPINVHPKIMVILDSNHTAEHVLKELRLYSTLVTPDQYMIVSDTFVDQMPSSIYEDHECYPGNSPFDAVKEFMNENNNFAIDFSVDLRTIISSNLQGYLKRMK